MQHRQDMQEAADNDDNVPVAGPVAAKEAEWEEEANRSRRLTFSLRPLVLLTDLEEADPVRFLEPRAGPVLGVDSPEC